MGCLRGVTGNQMLSSVCAILQSSSNSCSSILRCGRHQQQLLIVTIGRNLSSLPSGSKFEGRFHLSVSKPRRNCSHVMISSVNSAEIRAVFHGLPSTGINTSLRLSVPKHEKISQISCSVKPVNCRVENASAGLLLGIFVCFAHSETVNAEIAMRPEISDIDDDEGDSSSIITSHGKKVYTNYSVTGIPGDGRCLFRAVVHGACLRSGKPSPDESLQKELADELRSKVADEFVKRREETEWFIEGDFDAHVSEIRQPHIWGGEPELLMASHVLQMPITVYMHDDDSGGLIEIAEYGQEYGKKNPIRVLYHGYGHYESLQIPRGKSAKSKL